MAVLFFADEGAHGDRAAVLVAAKGYSDAAFPLADFGRPFGK